MVEQIVPEGLGRSGGDLGEIGVEVTAGELDDESVPSDLSWILRNIVDNADAMLRFFIRAFCIDNDSLMVSASNRAMWILLFSSDQTIPSHSRTRGALFRALDRARAVERRTHLGLTRPT